MNPEIENAKNITEQPLMKNPVLKVFGVGGAGGNAVDYMARQDFPGISFMAINTDSQALGQLALSERMILGRTRTRGLGAGGDPDMGRAAAQDDEPKLRELCAGADIICIVAGMGGGTGTGAAPLLARIARESGALTLGIVTLPFDYEGMRRLRQAQQGLAELKAEADGVICFPNSKMEALANDSNTGLVAAFEIANDFLTQGIRGLSRLLSRTGLMNVDFNDLCAVLRGRHEEASLACVEIAGENRVQELMDKLNAHPFFEGGKVLAEAEAVLVNISGGNDLKMSEVRKVMEPINRQCENAHIILGTGTHESLSGKLSITLIAARQAGNSANNVQRVSFANMVDAQEQELCNPVEPNRPPARYLPPTPDLTEEEKQRVLAGQGGEGDSRGRKKKSQARQLPLNLEIVSKGRFESTEPTIHGGEDLDVPTYIRRGVALN